jgi:hypothetical protein
MNHDARLGQGMSHASDLLDRDTLIHQLEQAIAGNLEPA